MCSLGTRHCFKDFLQVESTLQGSSTPLVCLISGQMRGSPFMALASHSQAWSGPTESEGLGRSSADSYHQASRGQGAE